MKRPSYNEHFSDDVAAAELDAAFELGRLDGALAHSGAPALRVLAGRIARDCLIAALRQEGHDFTEQRFHAWFAGLATLSDTTSRNTRPPRAMCEAILNEFAHSSWHELADLAPRLSAAMLAPQDLDMDDAHAKAHAAVAEARGLMEAQPDWQGALPFVPLAVLYETIARSTRFAPVERRSTPVALRTRTMSIDRTAPSSPRWAIEILCGEWLRQAGRLRLPIPLPQLIRLDALTTQDPAGARSLRADGLNAVARSIFGKLSQAQGSAQQAHRHLPGTRTTSRAPALFEILSGFGPVRSLQIERLLGASRLGVRTMVSTWDQAGAITRTTISGSHLYGVATRPAPSPMPSDPAPDQSFSSEAIDDFDASLALLDNLLAGQRD